MAAHEIFLIVFLILFSIHVVLERVLTVLNLRYVRAHAGAVPEMFKDAISAENYARSIEYTAARARFGHVTAIFSALLTLAYLFTEYIQGLTLLASELSNYLDHPFSELTLSVVQVAIFLGVNTLIWLPFNLWDTFMLEARFGFNKTDLKTFVMDRIKGLILGVILGLPFLYAALYLILYSGPWGWLYAGCFVIAFQFAMMILIPLVIAPLFNKFSPLQDGELKSSLEHLAERCKFATCGIFVVDGSRRSSHSNAYFTGLGRARRIVLFDTLVEQLSIPELSAVLAHEIGHYKLKHILKTMVFGALYTFVGFYVLDKAIHWAPLYQAFQLGNHHIHEKGLLAMMIISGHFTFWLGPLMNALSRKHEYEADAFAARATADSGGGGALESALIKLFEKNLGTLTPHPAYSAYHFSPPPLIERVGALRRVSAQIAKSTPAGAG